MVVTLGPVRVMGAGVAVMVCVEEVCRLHCLVNYTHACVHVSNNKSDVTVTCLTLINPDNGTINCSLGDDGVPSYEDTCSFICNIGYELTGRDTRTCQSNGSWSGSDAVCRRGS